ncbi:MAG: GNAT family N-acetyltransferase [Alphaproteobacteria bacterium]|nr:GNAT family N-acetyltransferase [Alphaproteobacteria bacterium]
MPTRVRPATPGDLEAICALLLQDGAERAASDGNLWPLATDSVQRIAVEFTNEVQNEGPFHWLVAEAAGAVVGVARLGVIPCPPIYHLAGQLAFVLFDDTTVSRLAPEDALALLIVAAEREGEALGAVTFIAACAPFQREKLRTLESAGYGIVTRYLVKHRLSNGVSPISVRAASSADIAAIVAMGGEAQNMLFQANAQMWKPHPEAPSRFSAWMHYSLTLPDRCIFIDDGHESAGFVIAQPVSSVHMPVASKRDHIGLIDDFWAPEFATATTGRVSTFASDLLAAAEFEFTRRGKTSAMAISPATWRSKQHFLREHGYCDGNAWMLKG